MTDLPVCAVLDDYQNAALACADWSVLQGQVAVRRYSDSFESQAAAVRALADCTIIVAMRERTAFPQSLLQQLPNLRLLITTGMRNRSIDLNAARQAGVTVCGTRSGRGAVAELAWGGLLAFMRNIPDEAANLRAGGPWQLGLGRALEGRRLGVVGLGKQGARMARFGTAFGMDVCGWTRTDIATRAADLGITALPLDMLFESSDVITIQLALNDATRGIIGRDLLARMRPDGVLVNTSRGALIDEETLIAMLRDNRITGAVLDVFETEPLPADHPFRTLPNVLATPHIGYVTQENYAVYFRDVVEGIQAWLAGAPLRVLT